jgi:MinD superfamily P-loop ATPase
VRIAVTGGKGGTGKSTIATALAVELSKRHSVLLMDLDVDCPNDHLILGIDRKRVKEVEQVVPKLDKAKCAKCGRCAEVCRESAVVHVAGQYPIFVLDQCIGCKACMIACPRGALSEEKRPCGYIYEGRGLVDFVSGEIVPGQEEGSPVVNAVKSFSTGKHDFTIVDTAAGTHCTVISALMGADLALAVTEPTPLGAHDLGLILDLTRVLGIPCEVVLNKAGIGDPSSVKKIISDKGSRLFGRLPYSKNIVLKYSKGEPIRHEAIKAMAKKLEEMV